MARQTDEELLAMLEGAHPDRDRDLRRMCQTELRTREMLRLKLASPHRAPSGQPIRAQDLTDALPLFVAACEPRML